MLSAVATPIVIGPKAEGYKFPTMDNIIATICFIATGVGWRPDLQGPIRFLRTCFPHS